MNRKPLHGAVVFAALLLSTPAARGDEPPPYPFAIPAWYTEQSKKLEKIGSVAFDGTPLHSALDQLEELSGVKFAVARNSRTHAKTEITIRVGKASVRQILDITVSNAGLAWVQTSKGILVGRPPLSNRALRGVQLQSDMERARETFLPTAAEKKAQANRRREAVKARKAEELQERKTRRRLERTRMTQGFEEKPVVEIMNAIAIASDVRIIPTRPAHQAMKGKVTTTRRNVSALSLLHDLVEPYGLEPRYEDGGVMIREANAPRPTYLDTEEYKRRKAAYEKKCDGLRSRRIQKEFRGKRLFEFMGELEEELDLRVYPTEEVWKDAPRLRSSTAGRTLEQLQKQLERARVRVLVLATDPNWGRSEDAIFLFKR